MDNQSQDITFQALYYNQDGIENPTARTDLAKALLPHMLMREHKSEDAAVTDTIKTVNNVFNNKQKRDDEAKEKAEKEKAEKEKTEKAAAGAADVAGAATEENAQTETKNKKGFLNRKTKSTSRGGRKTRRRRR
tara:strand:+ start:15377 stop:15778 length:402 start_codon:yes stop_codon:yes gene_type:complete